MKIQTLLEHMRPTILAEIIRDLVEASDYEKKLPPEDEELPTALALAFNTLEANVGLSKALQMVAVVK